MAGAQAQELLGRAGGRGRGAVDGGREHAVEGGGELEGLLGGRAAGQHGGPVENAQLGTQEGVAGPVEHVHGQVVAVGPDAELGVIGEAVLGEGVAVVGAGGVAAGGDGQADEVGEGRGDGELGDDPAVGQAVVEDGGVAVVVAVACPAEAGPQGVGGQGTEADAAGLAEDGEVGVDDLEVVGGADRAVRVAGRADVVVDAGGPAEALADALEVGVGRRDDGLGAGSPAGGGGGRGALGGAGEGVAWERGGAGGGRAEAAQWRREVVPDSRSHPRPGRGRGAGGGSGRGSGQEAGQGKGHRAGHGATSCQHLPSVPLARPVSPACG